MTVTYSLDVSTSSFFCLYKLLFRWKGSIWKSIWPEMVTWCFLYAILSLVYRILLDPTQRRTFEEVCVFFDQYSEYIPVTFMLGFYVSAVFNRWWQVFDNIGWIDTPCLWITQYIQGSSERARMIRRNCIRYCVLTQAMVYRDVASSVRKRFPTFNHLVTAGLMSENEKKEFESIESPHMKYWQPMHWLFSMVKIAKDEGMIGSDIIYVDLMEKLRQFRVNILSLTLYDWVPVPLVYTQVVHLGVRTYFIIALLGRQYLNPEKDLDGYTKTIDLYVPIMSIMQFIFFIGWMKVAEVLLNPLGEDDDDFECNWILDRNLQVGFTVVDTAYKKFPDLEKDSFWEDAIPEPLYTTESAMRPLNPQIGSCVDLNVDHDDSFMVKPRRRTFRRMSQWDGDVDDADVVPVYGLKQKDGSHYASGESLAFSSSFAAGSRRLSEMYKKMRNGGRIGGKLNDRNRTYSVDVTSNKMEEGQRKGSSDSIPRFDESIRSLDEHHKGRLWQSMPGTTFKEMMNEGKQGGGVRYNVDGTKEKSDASHDGPLNHSASWYNDSLPVIEEETERRKHTDTESAKSKSSPKEGGSKSAERTPERYRKRAEKQNEGSDSSSEMESKRSVSEIRKNKK